jgi:hypothetical protein
MPNTGIAADTTALNAGSQATGNINAGNAAHNASMNSAAQWFNGAGNSNQSAASIGLGLNNAQLQRNQIQNQQLNSTLGGIGSLAGLGMGFLGMRRGGVIKNYRPQMSGGRSRSGPKGLSYFGVKPKYAEGGMIQGPGTGTSDSIPASIEGKQPIALSNGEAVLNKEAVGLVGEDFIHRINAGGLAMLKRNGQEEGEQYGS